MTENERYASLLLEFPDHEPVPVDIIDQDINGSAPPGRH
jgi:hypothetical protein